MASNRLRFYLVRHGITDWNRAMRMQGHSDIPLNADGEQQAKRIGARLAEISEPLQAVWSSDLTRARVTAEAIAAPYGLTVQTTPLIRETMMGEWEGLTREDIEARGEAEHLARYVQDSLIHRPPGSETMQAVWERMLRGWNEIMAQHPTGQVAIVGHGGSLRALICSAINAPLESMRHIWLDNASLSIIEQHGDTPEHTRRITLLNDTSHLA